MTIVASGLGKARGTIRPTGDVKQAPASQFADDAELARQARDGTQGAFEEVVRRYERRIYVFTLYMVGNPEDAFDLTQECFLRAYRNLPRTSEDLNLSAWLHRIASNACLDVLRRRKRVRWLPWNEHEYEPLLPARAYDDPERVAIANENSRDVHHILDRMTERNRLALILREYEGLSTLEIGMVMNATRPAIKSLLFRARNEFRSLYEAEYGNPPHV